MTEPTAATLADSIAFSVVTLADFDELVALRIAAMRDSLERVGRFDPERASERLRKSFYPEHSEFIVLAGQRVGFYTFRPADEAFHLDHLYVHPSCQSRGVGSHVLRHLLRQSDARQMPVRLGALRDSPSNRFYQRHGFARTSEDEWTFTTSERLNPMTPGTLSHALQRTVPAVTLAASAAALPPTMQPARQPPQSLSLGALAGLSGVCRGFLVSRSDSRE